MSITGSISYPGIVEPVYMVATRTIGARPNTAIIFAQPQDGSPDCSGAANLSFGFDANFVTWTGCLCDRGTYMQTTHGYFQIFEIMDKRWLWKKAWFTRAYNVRQADGSIDPATVASVAQIALDLFTAMGEPYADVSAVVTDEFPELIYDHDNCVDAIEDLLNPRGFVISLQTDNTVVVYRRGFGYTLPTGGEIVSLSMTIDPPELPYYLTAVADKTVVQSKLACRPVGLDTDGLVKRVADLSYCPAAGWIGMDMESFNFITDPVAKQLASKTVGKWYQVYAQADGTFNISDVPSNVDYCPFEILVESAWQYLPLEPKLLTSTEDVFGKTQYGDAFVEGVFIQDESIANPANQANTDPFTRVEKREWKLDRELGIVKFSLIAQKEGTTLFGTTLDFADVYLTCTYSIHGLATFVKDKLTRSITLGGLGEDLHKLEEIQRRIIVSYTDGTSTVSSIADNIESAQSDADLFLSAASNRYFTSSGNVVLYRGIYPFSTDGASMQIKWDCAMQGPTPFGTHVSQFSEGLPLLPLEKEFAQLRRTASIEELANARRRQYRKDRKQVR